MLFCCKFTKNILIAQIKTIPILLRLSGGAGCVAVVVGLSEQQTWGMFDYLKTILRFRLFFVTLQIIIRAVARNGAIRGLQAMSCRRVWPLPLRWEYCNGVAKALRLPCRGIAIVRRRHCDCMVKALRLHCQSIAIAELSV